MREEERGRERERESEREGEREITCSKRRKIISTIFERQMRRKNKEEKKK